MLRRLARLALALPLILALAPPVSAQGLKAPLPGTPGACSPAEAAMVEGAFRDALAITRRAIARLDADPALPEFRRWFGTGPVAPVRGNLQRIAAWLAANRPSAIFCNPPEACPPGRFAFTLRDGGAMGFCALFFNARNDGLDSRPGVIVHEISHIAAGTRDIAYSPTNAAILAKQDPAAAAINADNYEYFVETAGRR